jgi:hypothetical protein
MAFGASPPLRLPGSIEAFQYPPGQALAILMAAYMVPAAVRATIYPDELIHHYHCINRLPERPAPLSLTPLAELASFYPVPWFHSVEFC